MSNTRSTISLLLALALCLPCLGGTILLHKKAGGCASPAPASITFWFNGDGGAVSNPTEYTLDGTTEHTADSDDTGTFATTTGIRTVANAALGGTNVVELTTDTGTDTLKYLGFTQTSNNIWGTQYGRVGCEVELDVDGGTSQHPRVFEYYEGGAGYYVRIINNAQNTLKATFSMGTIVNLTAASGLLDTASETRFWEFSWDTVADSFKLYVDGNLEGTDTTSQADFNANSTESIFIGNTKGSLTTVSTYLMSNCVIATGTAGRDLDLYAIVKTTGITDYNACNFP